ncbi:MAG: HrpE/YscL family type III secretion apparatus protein [Chlamydiales bacterium]|nr:HrpE/YscL family type III secretion apparatus protein [Chlamydiales bacterium]
MKFFDLLYKDELHLAPTKKVIPASEFSSLLEGKELIAKIQEEGVAYRQECEKECELLKEQKMNEGFDEGLKKWAEQLAACEAFLTKTKDDLEKMIVPVALKAAKKIVAKEIETHPETIVDIVKQSLKAVSQHRKFVIYVNKQDYAILDENRPKLKEALESVESLTVSVRDDILPGDATIETESGIISVKQEQLWKSLETAFHSLMNA